MPVSKSAPKKQAKKRPRKKTEVIKPKSTAAKKVATVKKAKAKTTPKKKIGKAGPKKVTKKKRPVEMTTADQVLTDFESERVESGCGNPEGRREESSSELIREEVVPAPEMEETPVVACNNRAITDGPEAIIDQIEKLESEDIHRERSVQNESGKKTVDQQSIGGEMQVVCFTLEGEEFGINIQLVREIIRMVEITGLPECPSYSLGIINLRGMVVDIYDLRVRLGYPSQEAGRDTRIIVFEQNDRLLGLVVDAVTQVLRINSSEIEATPSITTPVDRKFLSGILRQDERLVMMFEPFSLVE